MGPVRPDSRSPVPDWQPDGELEVTIVIRNTFFHLEPLPSSSARPARRCRTAPGALLTAALESGGPPGKGDGEGSWTLPWEGELSDGRTPEAGAPECRGDADNVAVCDGAEMREKIKNAFFHLEPVELDFSLRTARCNNTASEVLLAAAFERDTPLLGSEDCAEGLEEESTCSRASSVTFSSAGSREMDDAVSASKIGQEMSGPLEKKNNKKKHRGLRDSSGRRAGKKARELYKALVASLQDMVRQDPSLSLESLPLPQCVLDRENLRARLLARVEAARPAVC